MGPKALVRIPALCCALALCSVSGAGAHDLSHSQSAIVVRGREARVQLRLDLVGFGSMQWRRPDVIAYDELDERIADVFAVITQHFAVDASVALESRELERFEIIDNHVLSATIVYRFERAIQDLRVRSTLDRVTAADHQHLATIDRDGITSQVLLTARSPDARFEPPGWQWRAFVAELRAGAIGAVSRADALAFLAILTIGVPRLRSLAAPFLASALAYGLASAFVAADIEVAPSLLRVLVPLTIAGMTAANLLGGKTFDRCLAAAAFAFIVGIGHGELFRAAAVPAGRAAMLVAAFAIGWQCTQIVVAGAAFPLTRRAALGGRYVRSAASLSVAGLALCWMAVQTLLG